MNLVFFASLKKLKKHEFNFLQALKNSKQKHAFLSSVEKLNNDGNIFWKFKTTQKLWR